MRTTVRQGPQALDQMAFARPGAYSFPSNSDRGLAFQWRRRSPGRARGSHPPSFAKDGAEPWRGRGVCRLTRRSRYCWRDWWLSRSPGTTLELAAVEIHPGNLGRSCEATCRSSPPAAEHISAGLKPRWPPSCRNGSDRRADSPFWVTPCRGADLHRTSGAGIIAILIAS